MSAEGQAILSGLSQLEQCALGIASDVNQIKSTLKNHSATLADIQQCACNPDYSPITDKIQDMKVTIVSRVDGVEAIVLQNLMSLENILVAAIQGLETFIQSAIDGIKTYIEALRDVILAAISALRDVLLALFGGRNVDEILAAIADAKTYLEGVAGNAANSAVNQLQGFIDAAHQATRTAIDGYIGNAINSIVNQLMDKLVAIEALIDALDSLTEQQVQALIDAAHQATRQYLEGIIGNAASSTVNQLMDKLAELQTLIEALESLTYDQVQELVESAHQETRDYLQGIIEALESLTYDQVQELVESAHQDTRSELTQQIINEVDRIIQEILDTLNDPNNNTSLDSLIQKIDKLSEIIGVDEYPASLPSSLISKDEGWLGNLIPNPNVEIPNLTRLLGWYVERFDEIMGQWEIPIEIKDSDPLTPGDQPKGIKIPNLAEYAGETFLMQYSMLQNMEALVSMCTRILLETGQDKQQNYVTYQCLQTVMDYLGYDTKDKKVKLPMTFTPGKEELPELLKETEVNVIIPEYNERFSLEADLERFRKGVSILEALYWRKIDPNGDVTAQIMKELKIAKDMLDKVRGGDPAEEWETFKDDFEKGYSNKPGYPYPNKPYNKPYDSRPRIQEFNDPTQP